jgi:hypothetical protein
MRSLYIVVLIGCSAPAKPPVIQNRPQPAPEKFEEMVATHEPMDLVVAGGELYWVGPDNIYHAPDRPHSEASVLLDVPHPTTMVRLGDRLVFVDDSFQALRSVSMRGGESTLLVELPDTVWSMVDSGGLVVATYDPGGEGPTKILRVSGDGRITPVVTLVGQTPEVVRGPDGELLVSTKVDAGDTDEVGVIGRIAGTKWSQLAARNGQSIAGDHEDVYFVAAGGDPAIYRVPRRGGQPVEFATGEGTITAIAVDEKYVYWGEFQSGDPARLMRRAKSGGVAEKLVEIGEITTFAIVGPYLYWNDTRLDQIKRMRR